MATYETSSTVPFGAVATLNIVNFVDATVANIRVWNASRKTAKTLSALSCHQLEDIGLTCADLKAVSFEVAARRYS